MDQPVHFWTYLGSRTAARSSSAEPRARAAPAAEAGLARRLREAAAVEDASLAAAAPAAAAAVDGRMLVLLRARLGACLWYGVLNGGDGAVSTLQRSIDWEARRRGFACTCCWLETCVSDSLARRPPQECCPLIGQTLETQIETQKRAVNRSVDRSVTSRSSGARWWAGEHSRKLSQARTRTPPAGMCDR